MGDSLYKIITKQATMVNSPSVSKKIKEVFHIIIQNENTKIYVIIESLIFLEYWF